MSIKDQAPNNTQSASASNGNVEKCINCEFYDRQNAGPADGKAPLWGQCRRHAPRLNPVTAKAHVVEGVWPLVRDDDWCGEWKVLTRVVQDWVPERPAVMPPAALPPSAPTRVRLAPAPASPATASGDD